MGKFNVGQKIEGLVVRHEIFGFFVNVSLPEYVGLVELPNIILKDSNARITPEEYPEIGTICLFEVLGYREVTKEIWLRWRK